MFCENCYMQPYKFYMTVISNEAATQKVSFFRALEKKKLILVGKIS